MLLYDYVATATRHAGARQTRKTRSLLLRFAKAFSFNHPGFYILVLISALLITPSGFAQEATSQQSTSQTQVQPDQKPSAEELQNTQKQPKTQTRSTAMAATGDSAAGSIGGIGTPEGVKVTSGGGASLSIPIVVPPGTAGVQPNLSFNYSSQGENSLLGVGWSVGGLPVIHRCPRTVAQDNFRGGVNYDNNDRYCLDGQRLMAISGVYGANLTEYRTEVDSFLKIISYGTAGNGPSYFIVKTKGGETMEFGNTADSKIEAQGKTTVRIWALNKVQDVKGNYLAVTYAEDSANGEYRPTQIDYTGNAAGGLTPNRKVTFDYIARTDQIPQWVGGSKILTTKLLSYVKTYVGTTLVRDYRLEYETGTATSRSRLKRIKECDGNGNCLPANTPGSQPAWQYTWQEGGNGTFQLNQTQPLNLAEFETNPTRPGDFNGDGKSDLVTRDGNNLFTYFSNGNGTFQKVAFPITNAEFDSLYVWAGDFNGDGRTDIATYKNSKIITYFSLGNGSYQKTLFNVIGTEFGQQYAWAGDFNGDGREDLASYQNSKLYTYLSNGDGSYQKVVQTVVATEFGED